MLKISLKFAKTYLQFALKGDKEVFSLSWYLQFQSLAAVNLNIERTSVHPSLCVHGADIDRDPYVFSGKNTGYCSDFD